MTKQDNSRSAILARSHRSRDISASCRTKDCNGVVRVGGFGRCQRCDDRLGLYGCYWGRQLPRAYYLNEWVEAQKFVHRFSDHPNIRASREFILKWLRDAQLGQPVPGQRAIARLADRDSHENIAQSALIELIALNWYARFHTGSPTITPYVFANAFLKSYKQLPRGPQGKGKRTWRPATNYYISRGDRKEIAKELSRFFNPLFFEAAAWRDRENELHNAQLKAGATSFPNLCERCTYNERKRLERKRVREGGESRLTKDGKVDGRTRDGLRAAGKHINEKLKIKKKEDTKNGETAQAEN